MKDTTSKYKKEEIKIKGKKYLKYYEAISDCTIIENPRNKKTFAINNRLFTGGRKAVYEDCKCCGEPRFVKEVYVKPVNKKILKQMLEYGVKQIG